MAVTYGFYDSLNHDRLYNAQQMSAIFDGIINDGVFMSVGNQFHTVAGTGMQVIVKSGRAWFDSTWTLNDAEYPLSIDAADVLLTRIDAVVLEVNSEVATRANTIKVVKGTPASTPAKPTLTNTATIHQHALAYVTVAKNTTAITNSMIEIVVGKTETPYVTAILQTTDITDLFKKWENDFQVWFETVRSTLDGDIALNLQNQIDALTRSILTNETRSGLGLSNDVIPDLAFRRLMTYGFKNLRIEYITTSKKWTPPNDIIDNLVVVYVIGGGGGGGCGYAERNGAISGGGGGGSGYINKQTIIVDTSKEYTAIIGAGGAAHGDNTDTPGDNGSASSFDNITALGGYGGGAGINGYPGYGGNGEAGGGGGLSNGINSTSGSLPNGGNGHIYGGGGGAGYHSGVYSNESAAKGGNGGLYGGGGGGAGEITGESVGKTYVQYRKPLIGGSGGSYGLDAISSDINNRVYLPSHDAITDSDMKIVTRNQNISLKRNISMLDQLIFDTDYDKNRNYRLYTIERMKKMIIVSNYTSASGGHGGDGVLSLGGTPFSRCGAGGGGLGGCGSKFIGDQAAAVWYKGGGGGGNIYCDALLPPDYAGGGGAGVLNNFYASGGAGGTGAGAYSEYTITAGNGGPGIIILAYFTKEVS